jgi:hypothetical protein
MERLSPQQKDSVRGSARALGQMPFDRQQTVRQAFRSLRDLPPGERSRALSSPEYTGRFSSQERNILGNLLTVEPYQPR